MEMEPKQVLAQLGCSAVAGLVVLGAALFLGGFYRTEVIYSAAAGDVPAQAAFHDSLTVRHWLGGLKQSAPVDLRDVIKNHSREGEKVTSLTVLYKHSVGNVLMTAITLGIYSPVTLEVTGTVVK